MTKLMMSISNKGRFSSIEGHGKTKFMDFGMILESTTATRNMRLVIMNVVVERLKDVVKLIPAMGGPNIARVDSTPPMWDAYSVVEGRSTFEVIDAVKLTSARDIVGMKVIP
jgi:ATP phosphoribosyltransferase-like protein